MVEQFNHLPGAESVLMDGGMKVSEPPRMTERMVILGTAQDGPLMVPVRIYRPADVKATFGEHTDSEGRHNGASLGPAFNEAYGNGAREIFLMRISGTYSSLNLKDSEDVDPQDQLIVQGRSPGELYDDVQVSVADGKLNIWSRADKDKTQPTKSYDLSKYATYLQLISDVNQDAAEHDAMLVLAEGTLESAPVDLGDVAKTALSGGDSQMKVVDGSAGPGEISLGDYETPGTYRGALSRAYEIIQDLEAPWVVPTYVYVSYNQNDLTQSPSFTDAKALAEALYMMDRYEHPARGIIGIAPLDTPTVERVRDLGELLIANPPSITLEGEDGTLEDIGRYISIVAADGNFFDVDLGIYSNSASVAYAALGSNLPAHHSTTNTPLPGILGLRWNFPARLLDRLTGSGYVTLRARPRRGIVPTDDPTAAARDSDYASLSTLRVAQDIIRLVRTVAEPYYGRPITSERKTALENDIDVGLDSRRRLGMINYYDFRLFSTVEGYLRGYAEVELVIVPAFILKRLRIRISLRPDAL